MSFPEGAILLPGDTSLVGGGAVLAGLGVLARLGMDAFLKARAYAHTGPGGGFVAGQSHEMLESLRTLPVEIARLSGSIELLNDRLSWFATREQLADQLKETRRDLRGAVAAAEAEILNHIDGLRPLRT